MRPTMTLTALLLLLTAAALPAATLHPNLEAYLAVIAEDQPVGVIVHLAEQAPVALLDEQLKASRATRAVRHRRIVEELKAAAGSQEPLREHLEEQQRQGSVEGFTGYWISNLFVVYATKEEILTLAERADVAFIEPNFKTALIEPVGDRTGEGAEEESPAMRQIGIPPGIEAIRAPEVWHQLGIDGTGVIVGNCDTGVDGTHPALAGRWRGLTHPWQECWLDVLGNGTTFPVDNYGHGTHVMGTLTGQAPGDSIGVAPGATWIACNAIDQGVSTEFDNDIITAYQWFADPDGDPQTVDDVPDVIQNSWRINESFPGDYTDCDSRWWVVIDNAEAASVVTTWSAGNEGPGSMTIGSPADRATTLTNTFSVGAVNSTDYNWPYPIAGFSSRGPTGCNVPAENKIKPEISAPGVTVYSSVPGGGYEQNGWSGTSMAGPHVAGVVALMRQANPDLDVDTIKSIIMETARDEGTTGEDNTYGHGFIDAYEAVLAATQDYGTLQGIVRNRSFGDLPIEGAEVALIGTNWKWTTGADGSYSGLAAAGSYSASASYAGFATVTMPVEIVATGVTVQDFNLRDIAGPEITNVSYPEATSDAAGPYVIGADVNDLSTVADVTLYHRTNGSDWVATAMAPARGTYEASLSGASANSRIDFYIRAEDGVGIESFSPPAAPDSYYSIYITEEFYTYDVEDPEDPSWQLGMPGDDATTGIWVRVDPVGTNYNGTDVQPEDDHTADPGVLCFVTGNTAPGGGPGDNDVDNGCTTLQSPTFDLSSADLAFVHYWRWYGEVGNSTDDEFAVDVSDDGGSTWQDVERVVNIANSWTAVTADIGALGVNLTSQVVFRFIACDQNTQGLVEGAIDDFKLETYQSISTGLASAETMPPVIRLLQSRPNPFRPTGGSITMRFVLPESTPAELDIYDVAGRRVRTLARGSFAAGDHRVTWDGRDESGEDVGSGVYFYRLKAGSRMESRRLTVLR